MYPVEGNKAPAASRQEAINAPLGPIKKFTEAFNKDISFPTVAVAIDNFTGYWLYIPDAANPYIPPWWVGVVRNVIHATSRIVVQWASPFADTQDPLNPGTFVNITFTNYELPYAPGSLVGNVPQDPNNPQIGPPPMVVNICGDCGGTNNPIHVIVDSCGPGCGGGGSVIFEGDAFAAILRSSDASTDPAILVYRYSGDAPGVGWFAEPTVGPLQVIGLTPNFTTIISQETMSVRIEATAFFQTVADVGSASFSVLLNGGVIETQTVSHAGGLAFWSHTFDIDVNGILLRPGDVVSIVGTKVGFQAGGWSNLGANDTYLRVGRGTFVMNSGTVIWTGGT